jgi:site-specific recombinase XerD
LFKLNGPFLNRWLAPFYTGVDKHLQGDIAACRTARARKTSRGGQTAGGIGVAARAISTLRSLFNHARRLGLIEVSPATGVRIMASQNLKRSLGAGEIRHLGKVMTQMAREGEHPTGHRQVKPCGFAVPDWRAIADV